MAASDIDAQFGAGFARSLDSARQGEWIGLASGVGLHVVQVTKRTAGTKPQLSDIRQRLENDWRAEAIRAAEDKRYGEMLRGYDVVTKIDR